MQIVTLQQVKDAARETGSARDAFLTQLANGIEADIFGHLRLDTKAEVLASVPDELADQAAAILEHAVLLNVPKRQADSAYNIWQPGNPTARLLYPYRLPAIAADDSETT